MFRRALPRRLALSLVLLTGSAAASERAFAYTYESQVRAPGSTELAPWTTFSVGRQRYYSELAGRLELEHGFAPHLQAALYWNFAARTQDVVVDDLTGKLARISSSEFSGASLELQYQLSDAAADALGSALYLETTLGPRQSDLELRVIIDRSVGRWLVAANVGGRCQLTPLRTDDGSELEAALLLEPQLAVRYALPGGLGAGLELRAPIAVAGDSDSASLFGGPVISWADRSAWATLGALPQLLAFAGKSPGSRLDLDEHERLEVRLIAGFLL
jgi:hypothetical protein